MNTVLLFLLITVVVFGLGGLCAWLSVRRDEKIESESVRKMLTRK